MKNRNLVIPIGSLTQEEKNVINSLIVGGSLSLEEIKSINSLLIERMKTLQTQFREVDEDYRRVADGHTGDFDYLCSVSSRRAELYQQIESLKKAILKNRKVIENEEKQDTENNLLEDELKK
jgi:hypothetical protein